MDYAIAFFLSLLFVGVFHCCVFVNCFICMQEEGSNVSVLEGCGHALLAEAPHSVLADLIHNAVVGVSRSGLAQGPGLAPGPGLASGQGLAQLSLSFDVTPLSIPISPALVGTQRHHHRHNLSSQQSCLDISDLTITIPLSLTPPLTPTPSTLTQPFPPSLTPFLPSPSSPSLSPP